MSFPSRHRSPELGRHARLRGQPCSAFLSSPFRAHRARLAMAKLGREPKSPLRPPLRRNERAPPPCSATARHDRRSPCSGGPLATLVAPAGAPSLVESVGSNHTAGDLTAGENPAGQAIPCLRSADQWGRLTRWVPPICLCGAVLGTDPGAPSVFVGWFSKQFLK